jgi:Class II flagellar assembly regulator
MPGVSEVRTGTPLGGPTGPVRGGSSGFVVSSPATPESGGLAAPTPAVAATLVGALALQELGCEAPQDHTARRRGYDLLAALRALHRALLADSISAEPLAELATLATEVPEAADPRLRGVVAELVLRARVELARHEARFSGPAETVSCQSLEPCT